MTNLTAQMTEVIAGIRSEISVDKTGKGSITKNGLCNLLGISRSTFRVDREPKKLAEMLATIGFTYDDILKNEVIGDVLVSCIIEYYAFEANQKSDRAKTLYRAFAAVGVRAWFQDVTGFDKPKPASQYESFVQARDALNSYIAVMEYASDKPGQERINNFAVNRDPNALPGLLTIDDILERTGREHSAEDRKVIGMYAATAYRNLTGKKPTQVVKKYVNKSGNRQQTMVAAYPIDFLPVIENAIELGFMS